MHSVQLHTKMTVMAWSNTKTNQINEYFNVNGEINENIVQNGQIWVNSKDGAIFKEKEKKFRKSAVMTKLKFSVYCDCVPRIAFARRSPHRDG